MYFDLRHQIFFTFKIHRYIIVRLIGKALRTLTNHTFYRGVTNSEPARVCGFWCKQLLPFLFVAICGLWRLPSPHTLFGCIFINDQVRVLLTYRWCFSKINNSKKSIALWHSNNLTTINVTYELFEHFYSEYRLRAAPRYSIVLHS